MSETFHTDQLHLLLERFRRGDRSAWDELYQHVGGRLEFLAHRMLRGFPQVRCFESTGDVLQNALLRLLRALQEVQPGSVREFFGLASLLLRRELLDLKKHYCGPQGEAAHRVGAAGKREAGARVATEMLNEPDLPELEEWSEFHRQIDELPPDEREVIDLHFYQGLNMTEAAQVIGVNVRTVQRRWNSGLARLRSVFHDEWPRF